MLTPPRSAFITPSRHRDLEGVHGADRRLPLLKARSSSDVHREGCAMYRDDRLFNPLREVFFRP